MGNCVTDQKCPNGQAHQWHTCHGLTMWISMFLGWLDEFTHEQSSAVMTERISLSMAGQGHNLDVTDKGKIWLAVTDGSSCQSLCEKTITDIASPFTIYCHVALSNPRQAKAIIYQHKHTWQTVSFLFSAQLWYPLWWIIKLAQELSHRFTQGRIVYTASMSCN